MSNNPNQLELFPAPGSVPQQEEKFINIESPPPSIDLSNFTNKTDNKKYLKHAEWCYQFFDNEPVVFAYYKEPSEENNNMPLQIVLEPVEGGGLAFSNKGMSFRLFAREITEATLSEIKAEKNEG